MDQQSSLCRAPFPINNCLLALMLCHLRGSSPIESLVTPTYQVLMTISNGFTSHIWQLLALYFQQLQLRQRLEIAQRLTLIPLKFLGWTGGTYGKSMTTISPCYSLIHGQDSTCHLPMSPCPIVLFFIDTSLAHHSNHRSSMLQQWCDWHQWPRSLWDHLQLNQRHSFLLGLPRRHRKPCSSLFPYLHSSLSDEWSGYNNV